MARYSQDNRLLSVASPLGKDVLLLESFSGTESLSAPFQFKLEMLHDVSLPAVDFAALMGKPMVISVMIPTGGIRSIHGLVSQISEGAQVAGSMGEVTFTRYRAEIVPKFEFLKHTTHCRIYQQKPVPEILKDVLKGIECDYELQGQYEPRDYCTQYRESDFDFASRLMEEEGIYYYFDHSPGGHKMVVADTPGSHRAVPGKAEIDYEPTRGVLDVKGHVFSWNKSQVIRTGNVKLCDHSFELPGKNLEAKAKIQESVNAGATSHKLAAGGGSDLEKFDFPGGYADRFDGIDPGGGKRPADLQKIFKDNLRTANIRMQQEAAQAIAITADGDAPQMSAGHKFKLAKHFSGNGEYVAKSVSHYGSQAGVYDSNNSSHASYTNTLEALPIGLPFRPQRVTPESRFFGTVTGIVAGPAGEEIFTDDYGRIKVKFPWDVDGPSDGGASCWVRVVTPWAGAQWGSIHIPRVGMEVMIGFLQGNPDYPICLGSVYTAANMPPYKLPDNRTQSGIKSRSSLNGTADNFHELRFEDKKDQEEIYFHSEKDFNRVVENNDTLKVGFEKKDKGDRTIEIFNNHTVTIGAGNGQNSDGSETLSIYKDRTTTLKTGSDTLTIKKDRVATLETGNDTLTIKMGNSTTTIKMGNESTKLDLGSSTTEAMQSIELKVGQSVLKIDQAGITMKGMLVKIEGQIQTEVKGTMLQVTGTAMCKVGGGITMIG